MATIDVVIYRDGDYWTALALNVEVSSFGSSPEEARDAIREALRDRLARAAARRAGG